MTCKVRSGVCVKDIGVMVIELRLCGKLEMVPACVTCRRVIRDAQPMMYSEVDTVRECLGMSFVGVNR